MTDREDTALEGVRVVELANDRCAHAGKILADMGADVVLVEPPRGHTARSYGPFADDEPGPERSLWWWHYHTSKRGVTLDLEAEEGRAIFRQLVLRSDVLLECEDPGRLDALGLELAALREERPELITVSVTPFAASGPRRDEQATDLTLLASGGPVWSCGYDDHSLPPVRGGGNQAQHIASAFAVMSVLIALLNRDRTGQGQHIDIDMNAAANVSTEMGSYHWLVWKGTVQRQTGRHAAEQPTMPTQVRCADGRYVSTGIPPRQPREFGLLHEWLESLGLVAELPEAVFLVQASQRESLDLSLLGTDPETQALFGAAREALNLIASRLPAYEFFVGAQRRNMPVGIIYSPEEVMADPHFQARGFPVEVEHPELGRRVTYPGAPWVFHGTPWRIRRRAPLLGEDNAPVLGALGISPERQAELRAKRVI